MTNKEKSPQSIRLDEFRKLTGYTITEFSKQCSIPSPSTLHKIISEGFTPSSKILDKIITRFPQLNHDWVVLGYGEMIVKGLQTQETSINSLEKSSESSYQYIIQALRDHDFALNELSKAISKGVMAAQLVNKQVVENTGKMTLDAEKRTKVFFDRLNEQNKKVFQHFDNEIQKTRMLNEKIEAQNRAYIDSLDRKRSETNAESFDKLSKKVHNHLKESRELQEELIQKKIDEGIEKGINHLTVEMHKNAVAQTDFAIKALLEKFSLKKILPRLGSPDKVSSPKHQK
tara:strand:- start:1427 stop:2287 length:861 start_codon:yes stop_codon:yes gene_type:complete